MIGPDGHGLPFIQVLARSERLGDDEYDYHNTHTGADGSFILPIPEDARFQLGVDLGGCKVFHGAGGNIIGTGWHDADMLNIPDTGSEGIQIRLSEQHCVWQIRGVLLDSDGVSTGDVSVQANSDGSNASARTDADGAFAITVPESGEYRLSISIDGCSVYYARGRATSSGEAATLIRVSEADVTGLRFQLPAGACSTKISGVLLDAAGNPLGAVYVDANDGAGSNAGAWTDADGSFSITVPSAGAYRLSIWLDGCSVYHRRGGAVVGQEEATQIRVSESDVTGLRFQLPAGACSTKISGRVLDAEGNGIANAWVHAQIDGGSSTGRQASADGSFSITLPQAGSYRVFASINGCSVYYKRGGAVVRQEEATQIRVSESDVTGLRFQLPAGACSTKISGRVLDAEGSGIANTWVHAQIDGRSWTGHQTSADGSFSITLPEAGSYRVSARINGCTVYYKRGGVTGSWSQATEVRVSDSDVTGIRVQVREGMCELRISGRVLNADGSPKSGVWVSASGTAGNGGAHSGTDGAFSFAVPGRGSYRLSAWIDNCSIYRRGDSSTTDWNSATVISITNADVTGVDFRLPTNPGSLCN